jgi:hypothetical protein
VGAADYLPADKAGIFQCLNVLGRSGQGDGERPCKLANGLLPAGQVTQHMTARAVAKGMEQGVKRGSIINHGVEYAGHLCFSQPVG